MGSFLIIFLFPICIVHLSAVFTKMWYNKPLANPVPYKNEHSFLKRRYDNVLLLLLPKAEILVTLAGAGSTWTQAVGPVQLCSVCRYASRSQWALTVRSSHSEGTRGRMPAFAHDVSAENQLAKWVTWANRKAGGGNIYCSRRARGWTYNVTTEK